MIDASSRTAKYSFVQLPMNLTKCLFEIADRNFTYMEMILEMRGCER